MQKRNSYEPMEKEIFHVHTRRCKHAEEVEDFVFVEKAIELGASRIVFTDHCPFSDAFLENPFNWRMSINELPDYVESMKKLKKQYRGQIEVLSGLEVEYLPSFYEYYKSLRESGDLDILIIGQHFFEYEKGRYDFQDEDRTNSYIGICNATVEGIQTGLFDVVAHPDRAFRKKKCFDDSAKQCAQKVIDAAVEAGMCLEKNYTSMRKKRHFWPEFWELVPDNAKIIYGYDAHFLKDMEIGTFENGNI